MVFAVFLTVEIIVVFRLQMLLRVPAVGTVVERRCGVLWRAKSRYEDEDKG